MRLQRGGSSIFQYRTIWIAVVGVVVLAGVVPLLVLLRFSDHFDQVERSVGILGFSGGALWTAVTILERIIASRRLGRAVLDDAADRLMKQALAQSGHQMTRLLGTARSTTSAANLRYLATAAGDRTTKSTPATGPDAQATPGRLEQIGEYYSSHARDGRLVILGEPGAGKTVLAIELVLQLLQLRAGVVRADDRASIAVPIHFNIATWDIGQPLTRWLAARLAHQFDIPELVAGALVDDHRILPVLDGLDEMDPSTALPHRAAAAVDQLNAYLVGRTGAPLVITCRTGEYRRLCAWLGTAVRFATETTIQPLDVAQIIDYLDSDFSSPTEWEHRRQWQPLLDVLAGDEDPRPLLALGTPWRLTLSVAYHRASGDLMALLPTGRESQQSPDAPGGDPYLRRINHLLVSAFVPACTRLHPAGGYRPAEVTAWCRALAERVDRGGCIVLHEWWPNAGVRPVRRWHAAVVAATALSFALLSEVVSMVVSGRDDLVHDTMDLLRGDQPVSYGAGTAWRLLVVFAFPGLEIWQAHRPVVRPTRVRLRQLRTAHGRTRFARWCAIGGATGLVPGCMFGLPTMYEGRVLAGIAHLLGFATTTAVVFGVAGGLRHSDVPTRPRDPLRDDLTVLAAAGLSAGVLFGGFSGFRYAQELGYAKALPCMVLLGVALGISVVLAFGLGGHAWTRYAVAVWLAGKGGRLPRRLHRFLDWAHEAGIVRTAGDAYQFRHADLHAWLRNLTREGP